MTCAKYMVVNILLLCVWIICAEASSTHDCRGKFSIGNGTLEADEKVEYRCILKCNDGYQATGCRDTGTTNGTCTITTCDTPILKTIGYGVLAFVVGFVAIFAIPCCIGVIGFGVGGVVKGSCAACIQTPDTESGSCFACCQSIGTRLSKKAIFIIGVVGGILGVIVYGVGNHYLGCKPGEPKCV